MKRKNDHGRCYACGRPFGKREPVYGGNVAGLRQEADYCGVCFAAALAKGGASPTITSHAPPHKGASHR